MWKSKRFQFPTKQPTTKAFWRHFGARCPALFAWLLDQNPREGDDKEIKAVDLNAVCLNINVKSSLSALKAFK